MMHRRSLLMMLGLGGAVASLPNLPVAAAAQLKPTVLAAVAAEFRDPLYAIAFVRGPNGERYRHHMPATMRYHEHGGRPWADDLVVEFTSSFTGTVVSVEIAHADETLLTVYAAAMETPHFMAGSSVRVTFGLDHFTTEEA